MSALTKLMQQVNIVHFDQVDWMGFSGAERFADGSEPMIIHGGVLLIDEQGNSCGEVLVIVDAVQISFILNEEDENWEVDVPLQPFFNIVDVADPPTPLDALRCLQYLMARPELPAPGGQRVVFLTLLKMCGGTVI